MLRFYFFLLKFSIAFEDGANSLKTNAASILPSLPHDPPQVLSEINGRGLTHFGPVLFQMFKDLSLSDNRNQ